MRFIRYKRFRRASNLDVLLKFLLLCLTGGIWCYVAIHNSLWLWLVLIIPLFLPTSRNRKQADYGYEGEESVVQALHSLPAGYVAVTNFVVPGTKTGDIDLILIGPMGLVVAEVKRYPGTILFENGGWWRVRGDGKRIPLKNVSAQARMNAKALLRFVLNKRDEEGALPYVPIHTVLIFVDTARLNAVNTDIPALRLDDVLFWLDSLPDRIEMPDVRRLAGFFTPRRHRVVEYVASKN